jgi:beta-galactosidase
LANAQRVELSFNNDWQFSKDNFSFNNNPGIQWQKLSLPHTWNIADVMDDEPGYYRGIATYKKTFSLHKKYKGREVFLNFEGANQQATVFINGKNAATHTGGYTGFFVRLTPFLQFEKDNEIVVQVDNSHNKNIPPLSADFTFYGGIYRDVHLIIAEPIHFSFNKGSKGILISTPMVNKQKAAVNIKAVISNSSAKTRQIIVATTVYNAKKIEVAKAFNSIIVEKGERKLEQKISISNPVLWSTDNPYLYKVVTTIVDLTTRKKLDEISQPLGLRWFKFDAQKGFFLNDRPLKLIGASRHQDYKDMGNALPDSLAVKDVQLLKDMGGNFLRVAHYPQDPSVLQACDELGILASVEISVVNEITESDSFYNNCLQMQQEMIRQNFNHPSVIIWCYMNEILLRPSFNNDKDRQKIYFANIAKLAKRLDSITRKEDPYRPTMIAHHGNYNLYKETGLIDIPMITGWNLYQGWYGANIKDLPVYLDRYHKDYPGKPMMITEYGADADPRIRSLEPVRFDKSIEYATAFHQYYYKEIMARPFIAGAMIWNLADFNSETRNETMPHINNKGIMQWDRTPKDPYYYYKAMLMKDPFIKILGDDVQAGEADSGTAIVNRVIQVANNLATVELSLNGIGLQKTMTQNGIATFTIALKNGDNRIKVKGSRNGKIVADSNIINCQIHEPLSQLNILLGAKRSFIDHYGQLWIPGHEYKKGGWGWIAGKAFKLPKGQLPYGTDKNIKETFDDPIYQTQQTGISEFKIDAPDGNYELTLHFAELLGGKVEGMVYNLDSAGRTEVAAKRMFDVIVNNESILQNFNIAQQYGEVTPVNKKIKLQLENGAGIRIVFKPIQGEPVLNAVQLKRLKEN